MRPNARTPEQYIAELAPRCIAPAEPYRTAKAYIKHRCTLCGHVWPARPSNVLGGTGCPKCARGKPKHKTAAKLARYDAARREEGVLVKSERMQARAAHVCTKCGNEWHIAPSSYSGCIGCALIARLDHKGVRLFSAFGMRSKMQVMCTACGYKWQTTRTALLIGGACHRCEMTSRHITQEKHIERLQGRDIEALETIARTDKHMLHRRTLKE